MDDSSDRVQVQKSLSEKLIDMYTVDFNSNQQIIPVNGLSTDLNWIDYSSVLGSFANPTFKT
jgi:hypothetical protein